MHQTPDLFTEQLAIRLDLANPNHHLWNNNGTWWMHYTVYPTPITSERRRISLRTRSLKHARQKRDQILKRLVSGKFLCAA
ncbi:MAG TPA: hypothetical protein DCL00_00830 [Opitutae bacterium]|nr:hypothetical protein [Opitutae bacterium]HAF58112.1 hypothetical protein [Opitutae bacterium]